MNLVKLQIDDHEKEIRLKEYQGQRVVTFADVDELHRRPEFTASRNFGQHRKHFIEGVDYFHLSNVEIQSTKIVGYSSPKGLTLLTQSGYLMLVKSFQDELAWQVQRALVNSYFAVKREIDTSQLSPELQLMDQMWKAMANNEMELKETKYIAIQANEKADNVANILRLNNKEWRDKVGAILRKIAKNAGGTDPYRAVITDSYKRFEVRAGCKLELRLANMKERATAAGASRTKVKQINRLDVIASDKRLVEIYIQIIREMAIQYQVHIRDLDFEEVV